MSSILLPAQMSFYKNNVKICTREKGAAPSSLFTNHEFLFNWVFRSASWCWLFHFKWSFQRKCEKQRTARPCLTSVHVKMQWEKFCAEGEALKTHEVNELTAFVKKHGSSWNSYIKTFKQKLVSFKWKWISYESFLPSNVRISPQSLSAPAAKPLI